MLPSSSFTDCLHRFFIDAKLPSGGPKREACSYLPNLPDLPFGQLSGPLPFAPGRTFGVGDRAMISICFISPSTFRFSISNIGSVIT